MPIKFSFTNEDQGQRDRDYQSPRQDYPIQRGTPGLLGQVFGSREAPQVTPERYVRRVKLEEVTTNDSTVNLTRSLNSNSGGGNLVPTLIAGAGGALVFNLASDVIALGMKLAFALVAAIIGFVIFKQSKGKGGGDGSR